MAGWRGQSRVRADEEARAGDASTPESTIVGPRPEPPQRDEPPAGLPCEGHDVRTGRMGAPLRGGCHQEPVGVLLPEEARSLPAIRDIRVPLRMHAGRSDVRIPSTS